MGSVLQQIKEEAAGKNIKIQSLEEQNMTGKLNQLFYLDKNIEKELEFLRHVMTRGQETTERKGLHASSLIRSDDCFCYRQQVLVLLYKQKQGEQISPGLRRIFAEGDAIHEKWQRLFIRGGYAEPTECDKTVLDTTHCGVNISYTPDILCTIDKKRYIVEIKSVNTMQYQKMIKEGSPHLSGKKQLFFYMYLTGIPNGMVLCEDKNTQDFRVDLYTYNWEEVKPYVYRIPKIGKGLEYLREHKKMIAKHKSCISYDCKMAVSCPMREVCYRKEKGQLLEM